MGLDISVTAKVIHLDVNIKCETKEKTLYAFNAL